MKRFLALLILSVVGCATNPIPEGYTGPKALIRDSGTTQSSEKGEFFYLSAVNGKTIEDSLSATREANYGRGFAMTPKIIEREVPAQELQLKLEARVAYAAPILELANSRELYSATQTITLEAKPNAVYIVKGQLTEGNSSVWLEDMATGERVGTPVQTK